MRELQNFRATRSGQGRLCTRASLRQDTDMGVKHSQCSSPSFALVFATYLLSGLPFSGLWFPIYTKEIIILALSASWCCCKTSGRNDTPAASQELTTLLCPMASPQSSECCLSPRPWPPALKGMAVSGPNCLMTSRFQYVGEGGDGLFLLALPALPTFKPGK